MVEEFLTRIEIAAIRAKLTQTDKLIKDHPEQLKKTLALALRLYLEEVGCTRIASDKLYHELRATAGNDALLAQAGWRGIVSDG